MPLEHKIRTVRELVDRILLEQVEYLEKQWHEFRDGDATAALTDLEINFLLSLRKLEQEAEMQEAAQSYFDTLTAEERFHYFEEVYATLPEAEIRALPGASEADG